MQGSFAGGRQRMMFLAHRNLRHNRLMGKATVAAKRLEIWNSLIAFLGTSLYDVTVNLGRDRAAWQGEDEER